MDLHIVNGIAIIRKQKSKLFYSHKKKSSNICFWTIILTTGDTWNQCQNHNTNIEPQQSAIACPKTHQRLARLATSDK